MIVEAVGCRACVVADRADVVQIVSVDRIPGSRVAVLIGRRHQHLPSGFHAPITLSAVSDLGAEVQPPVLGAVVVGAGRAKVTVQRSSDCSAL